jgi:hypothetical protein
MRAHGASAALVALTLCAGARASADPVPATGTPEALVVEARTAHQVATAAVAALDAAATRARVLLRRARTRGVRREIACADEVLSRADVGARRGRDESAVADEAYRHADVATARRAMEHIAQVRASVSEAEVTARACIADVSPVPTGTQVRVTVTSSTATQELASAR